MHRPLLTCLLLLSCSSGPPPRPPQTDHSFPVPDGRVDGIPCGPETCPSGCCDHGRCVNGTLNQACGAKGAACQVCAAGQSCASGECKSVPQCATTCPGCCVGEQCLEGTAPQTCGAKGAACVDCKAQGKVCSAGGCISCNPACAGKCAGAPDGCGGTCTTSSCGGCCSGATCNPGTDNQACGAGGGACVSCAAQGKACSAGGCVLGTCTVDVQCYCCTPGEICFGFAKAECKGTATGTGGAGYVWFDGGQAPVGFCTTQASDRFTTASGTTTLHFSSCHPQSNECLCQTTATCTKTVSWSGC